MLYWLHQVQWEQVPEGWIVRGQELERLIARFDPANREAVAYLAHHFRRLGLNRALKDAGAQDGDDVFIADAVFEYFDETGEAAAEAGEAEPDGTDETTDPADVFEAGEDVGTDDEPEPL
mgnify:CR=1 FL=1